jgi:hypothetical protein
MTNESACASPWSSVAVTGVAVTGVAVTGVAVTGVAPGVRARRPTGAFVAALRAAASCEVTSAAGYRSSNGGGTAGSPESLTLPAS